MLDGRSVCRLDEQTARISGLMKPKFVGTDAVAVRPRTVGQQKENYRSCRTLAWIVGWQVMSQPQIRPPCFAEKASLRMRLQPEGGDEVAPREDYSGLSSTMPTISCGS